MLHVTCPSCSAINRVPEARASQGGRCGKCQTPLPVAGGPVLVTDASFEAEVTRATTPVLLDCWADWCGPCHALAPTIEHLARDYAGRAKIAKLDVEANPGVASRFGVRSIPTMLLFKNGTLVDRLVGAQPRGAIEAKLKPLLS